jgi:heat shock protein HslJ
MRIDRAVAVVALLALAACASSPAPARSNEPPLVGTEWQLASYKNPGQAGPTAVQTDSTIEFNGRGAYSAHACNYISGGATINTHSLTFTPGMSTAMACGGEPNILERELEATAKGSVGWSIRTRILTLANRDGHVLTYRVRASIYPDTHARTIVSGDRAGGQFRLAVDGPTKDNDHRYIVFETRTAPGEQWGVGSMASPGPKDCLADSVLGVGRLGGQTFLATWATPDVAKVTTQATKNSPGTPLRFYDVPGTTLRIAGLWTATFRPSVSPVTFYDKDGKIIAAYPEGPC